MDRLTKQDENGRAYFPECVSGICQNSVECGNTKACSYMAAVAEKLAGYEDTGLTPEEAAKLAKAKEDGRLVELPCKPGTALGEDAIFTGEIVCEVKGDDMTNFLTIEECREMLKDRQEAEP